MCYTDADSGVTYRWSLEVPSFAVAQCIASGDYQNGIQAILKLLYGDAVPDVNTFSDLAHAVATDAWLDFIQRLQSLFGENEKLEYPVASGSCLTWSGVLDLGWCWRGKDWTLRLSHSAIDMLLGTPFSQSRLTDIAVLDKPLTRLDDVVGSESIALRAALEPVRLTLGQLQRLDIGDTVIFPHSLKLPLNVKTSQGEFVCEAWLGQVEHHTAIELIEKSVSQSKSQSALNIT